MLNGDLQAMGWNLKDAMAEFETGNHRNAADHAIGALACFFHAFDPERQLKAFQHTTGLWDALEKAGSEPEEKAVSHG